MNPTCNIPNVPTQRLGRDNYKASGPSMQSQLSHDDIKSKLENYLPVEDVSCLVNNTHVRYFIQDRKGNWLFRLGGFIKTNDHPDYLILSTIPNGCGKTWSVQKKNARFYRIKRSAEKLIDEKLTHEKINQQYQKALEQQQLEIQRLRKELQSVQGGTRPSGTRRR